LHTLMAMVDAIEKPGSISVGDATGVFEEHAREVRDFLRKQEQGKESEADRRSNEKRLHARVKTLEKELEKPFVMEGCNDVSLRVLEDVLGYLKTLEEETLRVMEKWVECDKPKLKIAREKWNVAYDRVLPFLMPSVQLMGMDMPCGAMGVSQTDVRQELIRRHEELQVTATNTKRVINGRNRHQWERELASLRSQIHGDAEPREVQKFVPDAKLVGAALDLRDAWVRSHKTRLLPVLYGLHARLTEDQRGDRKRPMPDVLRMLAGVFPVAGCTLLSMRQSFPLEPDVIDRLVIDEAGQCAPVYAVPALARAKKALITGDVAQLTPVYTLDDRADQRIARDLSPTVTPFRMATSSITSSQAVAESRNVTHITLVEHFRSQPDIVRLASTWSGYSLDVRTPVRSLTAISPWLSKPVILVRVRGHGERTPSGVVNEIEARKVIAITVGLIADGVAPSDIAVLTPFVGQSTHLEQALYARGLTGEGGVLVRTVHKLQGGERRVVIFSLTATQPHHLAWVVERPHLLHVATSRAQDHLVVVLDPDRASTKPGLAALCGIPSQNL
jgi:AAA domain